MKLTAAGIEKRFGKRLALRRASFELQSPALVALLGANGAGKSTLLSLLSTTTKVDAGELRFDAEPAACAVRRGGVRVAMVGHDGMLYGDLSGRENLLFFARLAGFSGRNVDAWLEAVGLAAHAERAVREYSRGMQQRLGLARALSLEPDLLLLDEPFSGLDASGSAMLQTLLEAQRQRHTLMLMSTHDLSFPASSCDRVMVLEKGRLLFDGPPDSFQSLGEVYAHAMKRSAVSSQGAFA